MAFPFEDDNYSLGGLTWESHDADIKNFDSNKEDNYKSNNFRLPSDAACQ